MLSLYWLLSIGIRSLPACGSRDRLQESGPGVCVAVELHALTALERREFVGVKLDSETAGSVAAARQIKKQSFAETHDFGSASFGRSTANGVAALRSRQPDGRIAHARGGKRFDLIIAYSIA